MTAQRTLVVSIAVLLGLAAALRFLPVRPLFTPDLAEATVRTDDRDTAGAVAKPPADPSVIVARPLFNATRSAPKPRPAKAAPEPVPVQRAPIPVLLGTMKTRRGERVAYLRFDESGETVRMAVGDQRGPWQVERIADGVVTLFGDGENVDIELSEN